MACKPNELAVLKGTSVMLDPDTIMILAFMYHTEKGDRSKSEYRYEGRILKLADLKAEITKMENDASSMWKWPNLDEWNLAYDGQMNAGRGAKWLNCRISKAYKNWDDFMKLVRDGIKPTGKQTNSAKYDLDGYTIDGLQFSITTAEDALKYVGKSFTKPLTPKAKPVQVPTAPTQTA